MESYLDHQINELNKHQRGGLLGNLIKEENPSWPPTINSIVVVKSPKYKELFIGKVCHNIWNKTACVIALMNNHNYVETTKLPDGLNVNPDGRGVFLLLPSYGWKYCDDNILQILIKARSPGLVKLVNDDVQRKYALFRKTIDGPESQQDLTTFGIYKKFDGQCTLHGVTSCKICVKDTCASQETDSFKDTSLLDSKGAPDINLLFKEKDVNKLIYDNREKFKVQKSFIIKTLESQLKTPVNIDSASRKIIVNKTVALKNIITTKEDEINEGEKIVKWLVENLVHKKLKDYVVFDDLKIKIFNGYVHISRKGIRPDDFITTDLVPNLNYLKWQYNAPIDYDTLKFLLFQTRTQQSLVDNLEQQTEAEKILSQEYLIALQPEPQYLMWCLKRLIMCWYANVDLQRNIRKIKVLINQWRARSSEPFNQKYGVQPSIVVYPRYGKTSTRIVLSRLVNYFLFYQNIGWSCSEPTYFVKVNDLMWYSNGAIDLKMYFNKTKERTTLETVFNADYTAVTNADDILLRL